LKDGLLCSYKSEDTEIINEILNEVEEHPNWIDRNYCLFFQFHRETKVGEYIITVDTHALDSKELYVADLTIAQNIFNAIYYGKEELFLTLANQYWDSVMPLEDYLRKGIYFKNPEILYLCNINPHQIYRIEKV
jgi:hypothetical protein